MKIIVRNKLFTYLDELNNLIECLDIGIFIDDIIQWLLNDNLKISIV